MTFPTKSLVAAAIPILTVVGLFKLFPQRRPIRVTSTMEEVVYPASYLDRNPDFPRVSISRKSVRAMLPAPIVLFDKCKFLVNDHYNI